MGEVGLGYSGRGYLHADHAYPTPHSISLQNSLTRHGFLGAYSAL